jgi:hypothetical protein
VSNRLDSLESIVGKTIASAMLLRHKVLGDPAWIKLTFSDDTYVIIESVYGGYDGDREIGLLCVDEIESRLQPVNTEQC